MKPPTVKGAPALAFPILQIDIAEMVERMGDEELLDLLLTRAADAWGRYIDDWRAHNEKLRAPDAYKLKSDEQCFRGEKFHHPLERNAWADGNRVNAATAIHTQFDRALQAKDWQEVMVLASMLTVREMLYGRAVTAAPAKAKAVPKTAQKKPATKKPGQPRKSTGYSWKPSPPRVTPPAKAGNIATLKDLVAQARPLFAKNPKLDRQGLINKIGRRYERLTTFDELRTLCAGKTVTTHSVKKPAAAASAPAPKAKRPRVDPARPVVLPESSIPKGVRTKPWPQPISGTKLYSEEWAEHAAQFEAGEVSARFTALETENGWTHGCRIDVADKRSYSQPLSEDGPLAQDADTAIRDCTATALHELKGWLKESEPHTDAARELAPHVVGMLKLRSWLLGFQGHGVEKIKFLQQGGQLELAA